MNEQFQISPSEPAAEKKRYRIPGVAAFYVGIAVDIILLYLFNNLKFLNLSVLNKDPFISCLWAINLSLSLGILGNFVLLLYRPRWFYHLVQVLLNSTVILAFYVLYTVFPFNFNQEIFRTVVRIALIVVMAGTGIAVIVELVRFGIALMYREPPSKPLITTIEPLSPDSPVDNTINPPAASSESGEYISSPDSFPSGQSPTSESETTPTAHPPAPSDPSELPQPPGK